MKFLVIARTKSVSPGPAPAEAFKAALDYFTTRLANGVLDCAYSLVPNGGMGIANVDSAEQLMGEIASYPLMSALDWEVQPLADIKFALELAAKG
jgi:hypothetical protein